MDATAIAEPIPSGNSEGNDAQSIRHLVDPSRLSNRDDDILGSYSADKISSDGSIRKPFEWRGSDWITVGIHWNGPTPPVAHAYRLLRSEAYTGEPTTYREKTAIDRGDYARNDVNGFYHGMAVKLGKQKFVLCGPEALFVAGDVVQPDLFDGDTP